MLFTFGKVPISTSMPTVGWLPKKQKIHSRRVICFISLSLKFFYLFFCLIASVVTLIFHITTQNFTLSLGNRFDHFDHFNFDFSCNGSALNSESHVNIVAPVRVFQSGAVGEHSKKCPHFWIFFFKTDLPLKVLRCPLPEVTNCPPHCPRPIFTYKIN